ncbi:MAG: hypothetical protein R6W48_12745 [Gaiellaceae bacterium]
MRLIMLFMCALVAAAAMAASVAAGEPSNGTLSIERGKGLVVLEIRGSVLGRLSSGMVRVTDTTPNDRFVPVIAGRRLTQERIGPRTTIYRGQGLRFRMLGGGYRIVARGEGLSLSAVGRGYVVLLGERKLPTDDAGVYSVDGVDCSEEPDLCLPLPSESERHPIRPWQPAGEPGSTR